MNSLPYLMVLTDDPSGYKGHSFVPEGHRNERGGGYPWDSGVHTGRNGFSVEKSEYDISLFTAILTTNK